MTETSSLAVAVASISAAVLALLGVDYYALLWGVIGAVFSLLYSDPIGRRRAIITVLVSSFVGAAVGSAIAEQSGARSLLIVAALICAAGARPIVATGIQVVVSRVGRLAGSGEPPVPPAQ